MMESLIDEASRLGVREIWGAVTLGDATATPTLLDWYGKFGFQVADRDEECLNKDARWKVRLDLPRPQK
jgi:L-amino acid N-acyltransferase YncA